METILVKAGCYVAIILLGIFLRRIGFFKKEDFTVLSKIVIRITLPAAIIVNAAGRDLNPSMLAISALALGAGIVYMLVGWLINCHRSRGEQAFGLLNMSGYNIGNFALPFTQGFLGPTGVFTATLFDVGNACICLGTAYGIAQAVKQGGKPDPKPVLRALSRSVPFITYVVTVTMNLLHIPFPGPVIELAQIGSNANAFMAMLMIGVGFHLEADRTMAGRIVKFLLIRFGIAAALACIFYFLLPYELEIRKALVLLAFAPIGSAVPGFTGDLGEDVGLSSALNSLSIICSIVIMVTLLLFMP